jgi:hypothetical protein
MDDNSNILSTIHPKINHFLDLCPITSSIFRRMLGHKSAEVIFSSDLSKFHAKTTSATINSSDKYLFSLSIPNFYWLLLPKHSFKNASSGEHKLQYSAGTLTSLTEDTIYKSHSTVGQAAPTRAVPKGPRARAHTTGARSGLPRAQATLPLAARRQGPLPLVA